MNCLIINCYNIINIYIMIKKLFILWFQGFNNAPHIIKKCVNSWKYYNPDWEIILIDNNNIKTYINTYIDKYNYFCNLKIQKCHLSDIVRMMLLKIYGGLWVDSTVFCNKPLSKWLPKYIKEGFFAFYKPGKDRLISNWFLYSANNNYIIDKWHDKTIKYYTNHKKAETYFIHHILFGNLYNTDKNFKNIFDKVPKFPASKPHILQKHGLLNELTLNIKEQIDNKHIPLFKLTYKINYISSNNTILGYLFQNNNNNNNIMEKTFNKIYETKQWGNTLSGPGSTIKSAENIIPYIINIIKTKNIKKIVDGSCGDCNWIIEVLKHFPNIIYVGNDVSSYIIDKNKEKFKNNKNYSFFQKNVVNEEIEHCDLFIFRHTMMHLNMSDNIKILNNIKRNCKYVLLTHHAGLTKNIPDSDRITFYDSNQGFRWVKMSLNHHPFDLDPNRYLISKQKESSNNSSEFLCLYLINRKNNIYNFEELRNLPIIENLNNIIKNTGEKLEGNILYNHLSNFELITVNSLNKPGFDIKRQNLYNLSKNSKNILEIGFNGGHSSVLYFYSNPSLELLSFDIALHKYTKPCVKFLQRFYNIEFIEGDSNITVKNYNVKKQYDVIHIDGGHGKICAENDLINCKKFSYNNTILVFDDTNQDVINNLLNQYINKLIVEIEYNNIYKKCNYHRLFKYI